MQNFYFHECMFQRFRCVFFLALKASMGEEDSEEFKQHVYRLEHSFGQKGRPIPLKYIVMGVDDLNIINVLYILTILTSFQVHLLLYS